MCDHCGCGQDRHTHEHENGHGPMTVHIQEDVLAHNRAHAEALKKRLAEKDIRLVNIIGSPGSGKTELLTGLIPIIKTSRPSAVIEGDLATENDAKRIRKAGVEVHQIQTGTACHLSVHDIEHAISHLFLPDGGVLFVENVGNLVCPALFDIGESLRIVCLSVTEGEDKPEKYPVAFLHSDLAVITKIDLLPHVAFDVENTVNLIRHIHPDMRSIVTSAKTGEGLDSLASSIEALWK